MKIIAAPLAGWTDLAFRRILVKCGAKEVWTEMISATALARGNPKTLAMAQPLKARVRQVVQLFGNNPADFYTAITAGALRAYDEINLNMGCPAPKIIKNHSGCWLMRAFEQAAAIIDQCRAATKLTGQKLSVKCRLGWDSNVAVAFAQMCVAHGVDRLIVHGRLGVAGYRGSADYAAVAAVKAAVKVPVIANGDIKDRASAQQCLAVTRADGVMVGRALCGAPWKIKLNDRTPKRRQVLKLVALHRQWHQGNPADFIKHQLSYDKQLKHIKR